MAVPGRSGPRRSTVLAVPAETLRVRLQKGEVVIELEGDAAAVQSVLSGFMTDCFGCLLDFFDGPGPTEPGDTPVHGTTVGEPWAPLTTPARSLTFAVATLTLPQARGEHALDLDGDGRADNQLGNVIGAFTAQNLGVQDWVDDAVAGGAPVLLFRVDTASTDLTADQRADVSITTGTPVDAARSSFTIGPPAPGSVRLPGRLTSGRFVSQSPLAGGTATTVVVPLPLFPAAAPLALPLRAASLQFTMTPSGSYLTSGQLNGAVPAGDVDAVVGPALASQFTALIAADPTSATSQQIAALFDTGNCTNPDGSAAHAGDGRIDLCEVLGNPIVRNVLGPDLDLFDGAGHFAPTPGGPNKDSLSFGFAFSAEPASF